MNQHGPFCEQCVVTENHDLIFCSLHAAAPMLLAALEGLGAVLEDWSNTTEGATDEMFDSVYAAQTAIRAAKGEN